MGAHNSRGELIIIGGHEEKSENKPRSILDYVAKRAKKHKGHLLLMTVASQEPEAMAREYRQVFGELGIHDMEVLDIRDREEATRDTSVAKVREAGLIFFTGGDQLRITSQIGDSPTYRCLSERFWGDRLTIAGTSAGAAAIPETILISGPDDTSTHAPELGMAPGLGLLSGVVIDSHFAERGRMGRLLGAVAQNPKNLGLGIDEDTAVIVECGGGEFGEGGKLRVIGAGAVYVVDGTRIDYSSLSERKAEGVLTICNVT